MPHLYKGKHFNVWYWSGLHSWCTLWLRAIGGPNSMWKIGPFQCWWEPYREKSLEEKLYIWMFP